ncbi:spore coat U domain-containing protein [Immundisolibacter sp.]|uniref:Csu type fimbrial protein n=1 Tax=Immundisolibacter sp. TaxID=1934948 RepID=UPI002618B4FF|nr:spore coat U domain-containing protein [Immundisolibacter sp.]MDD3651954.1 spore coat U domain-containing protein [Immundisolibacter sp.]
MKLRHPSQAKPSLVRLAMAGLAAGSLALPLAGQAATQTDDFTVSANVTATCTITAADLSFGDYNPSSADMDSTSTISVQGTNGDGYNVGLNAGAFSGATVTTRRMTGTDAAGLSYALYSDSTRTANWGDTAPDTVSGTGNGSSQTLTVYGRIPAGQWVQSGAYSDTITATITY